MESEDWDFALCSGWTQKFLRVGFRWDRRSSCCSPAGEKRDLLSSQGKSKTGRTARLQVLSQHYREGCGEPPWRGFLAPLCSLVPLRLQTPAGFPVSEGTALIPLPPRGDREPESAPGALLPDALLTCCPVLLFSTAFLAAVSTPNSN